MTLTLQFPETTYTATGAGGESFPVVFSFAADAELVVSWGNPSLDPVFKVIAVDFLIAGDRLAGGAVLTPLGGLAPVAGDEVKIRRSTAFDQPDTYGDAGGLSPAKVGASFDRVTRMIQELGRDLVEGGGGGGGGGGVGGPVFWSTIIGKPSFGDLAFLDTVDWTIVSGKPTTFPPSAHTHAYSALTGLPTLGSLAGLNSVNNGNWSGTALALGNGGTGSTTAAAARTALGLAIGTDVLAYNAGIAALAGSTPSSGKVFEWTSATAGHYITTPAGGGGGGTIMPVFTTDFGGVGDGTTNNDAAFTAAEGTADQYIWLPAGYYKTTKTKLQLTKRYMGPGTIWRGTGNAGAYPNFARYSTEVHPTVDQLTPYGLAEALEFSSTEYKIIDAGMRKNFDRYLISGGGVGFPPYFWAPASPHFARFENNGGWSGLSGLTTTAITAGSTTSVSIGGGIGGGPGGAGWQVGDVIGFTNIMDGVVTETRTLTGAGAGAVSWAGALSNSYPIGTTLTHGYRTMNAYNMVVVNHAGGGDCGGFMVRMFVNYVALDSQTQFQHRATGQAYGTEIVLQQPGNYGTGHEGLYEDAGTASTGLIQNVSSYVRTNNAGGFGTAWMHEYSKMDGGGTNYAAFGLVPIDGLYVAALAARTLLDFTNSRASVAAIALPLDQKISLDAQIVAPGPSNGNGYVATTDGGMYIYGTTVSGVKVIELQNAGYRLRLQANGGLTTNAGLSVGSNIAASGSITSTGSSMSAASSITSTGSYVYGAGGAGCGLGQYLSLNGPGASGTGLFYDGATIFMKKGFATVALW